MSRFLVFGLCFCVFTLRGVVGQGNQVCLTLPPNSVSAIGPKGVQGEKGEAGDVESCGCNPGDIAELREKVRALRDSHSCAGGLVYNNKCIKLAGAKYSGVTFTKAEQVCSNLNATLVEITSDEMYNQVYEYLKNYMIQYIKSSGISWIKVNAWLGSRFEPTTINTNNLITLRNGNNVKLLNWYPSEPLKSSSHSTFVQLVMAVPSRDDNPERGMSNTIPTRSDSVPLCAIQLPN